MKKYILLNLLVLIHFIAISQIKTEYQLKTSFISAEKWFLNLDSENYPEAYSDLSLQIKERFDSLSWIIGIKEMRSSFGNFIERNEVSRKFNSQLEGLPDGYYATFQYESKYNKTHYHTEQLIMHQDDKRKWRILEYSYNYSEEEEFTE